MNAFLDSIGYQSWILPALLIIPLLGAAAIWVQRRASARGHRRRRGRQRRGEPRRACIALLTFAVEFVVSLGLWWSFDPANAAWQSVVDMPWIPSWGIRFTIGVDGIAVMMILLTTFIMLLAVVGSWTSIRSADAQLLRAAARAHDGHARRVHGARSLPVLRDVGSDARADVLHRRHLGRRAAHLREHQVLPLHDGRLAADARRRSCTSACQRANPATGLPNFNYDYVLANAAITPTAAHVAVRRVLPRVRGEGADVPVPYVAARRARRSADGRLGGAGEHHAEARHVRLPSLRRAAVSRRGDEPDDSLDHPDARRDRHRVRRARVARAAGLQEARRLFVGEPPWLRDARHLRAHACRACRAR